jgi:hypothetical protein
MSEKLTGLFLHYHTTEEGKAELLEELQAEIEQLVCAIGEWSRKVGGLPQQRHPSHLIDACDGAISRALSAGNNNDCAGAFASLQRARGALANIQEAWEANLAYEAARAAYEVIVAWPSTKGLSSLLTLHDLALLLDETFSLLQRHKYRQGDLLASVCQLRSKMFSERQPADSEVLESRLQQQLAFCDEVAPFLPPRDDWADKSALGAVQTLLQEGYCALAQRLLDDLDVEFRPHQVFLATYRELGSAISQQVESRAEADRKLRELITEQDWSVATSYLLQTAFDQLDRSFAGVPAEMGSINQRVTTLSELPAVN